jgi:DNA mismatch repair protein MutL
MSVTDARMCFERHATSKIKSAEDLFRIRTMGFRGEAMASIASVAHVELKTKRIEDSIGTRVVIEGSELKTQEPVNIPDGTNISVKNLFFNVPARRKFLSSDKAEFRKILDEFNRVALAHPDISFELIHNNSTISKLSKGNTRKRIVELFGKSFNEKIVPVEEQTDIVKISGYVGKPEAAKKTGGNQFLFVNNRFIKSPSLYKAILSAYDQLIQPGTYPAYFIYLDVPPESIDVNIHPTKIEVKFEDEQSVFLILKSAVKMALGKHSVTPSIDFDLETSFDLIPDKNRPVKIPQITVNPDYNPFKSAPEKNKNFSSSGKKTQQQNTSNWESLLEISKEDFSPSVVPEPAENPIFSKNDITTLRSFLFNKKYIVISSEKGFEFIAIRPALERIYFSQIIDALKFNQSISQQELFPIHIQLTPKQADVVKEILPQLKQVGIDLEFFSKNKYVVKGLPAFHSISDPQNFIEEIVENYDACAEDPSVKIVETVARLTAKSIALRKAKNITENEAGFIIQTLFECENYAYSPSGKPTIYTFTNEEIDNKFS